MQLTDGMFYWEISFSLEISLDPISDRTRDWCLQDKNLNPFAYESQYRNHWNAPGVSWLVRDVVFLDLLDLAGAPRHAHRRRVQEHHRYVFRDAGNACHRACEQSIWSNCRYMLVKTPTILKLYCLRVDCESLDRSGE